jgi:hypothetical protein
MIVEPARCEALDSLPWDEARACAAILLLRSVGP